MRVSIVVNADEAKGGEEMKRSSNADSPALHVYFTLADEANMSSID